jgi:hypothetical protein
MIRRNSEPSSPTWSKWKEKAADETSRLIEQFKSGNELRFSTALYKAERNAILGNFFEKCAYCESRITVTQHIGDVEHYRPKARVRDMNGSDVLLPDSRRHPGYYWLVYDWRNLLPACEACNRPGSNPQGLKSGKHDRFPVLGNHSDSPGKEGEEDPLLLNPLIQDDPEEHLIFDPETGIVAPKYGSQRGRVTIDLLGLNRDALVDARRDAARRARFELGYAEQLEKSNDNSRRDFIQQQYMNGRGEYSAICKTAVLVEIERIIAFAASIQEASS